MELIVNRFTGEATDVRMVIGPSTWDTAHQCYVKMVPVQCLHIDRIGDNGVRYICVVRPDHQQMWVAECNLRKIKQKDNRYGPKPVNGTDGSA